MDSTSCLGSDKVQEDHIGLTMSLWLVFFFRNYSVL